MCEIEKSLFDAVQGRPFLAEKRLTAMLDELTRFYREIVNIAREQGSPDADRWEEELDRILSAPLGSLGNILGKTDLS